MIPPSFIFDETQESMAARAYRDKLATGLMAFVGIGAAAAVVFVGLSEVLVPQVTTLPAVFISLLVLAAIMVPTYLVQYRFAFFAEADHAAALPRYVVVQLAVLALAVGFSFIAHGVVGIPHLGTVLLVYFLTAGINFAILRRWAFASR